MGTDQAVRKEIRKKLTSQGLRDRIQTALDRDDIESALMYQELAEFARLKIDPETRARIQLVRERWAGLQEDFSEAKERFVPNRVTTTISLMESVRTDLKSIGDIRDIAREGKKIAAGTPYDATVLHLAVVGAAITNETAGKPDPAKIGVSVMKVARKTGTLPRRLREELDYRLAETIHISDLHKWIKNVDLDDYAAIRASMKEFTPQVKHSALYPTLAAIGNLKDEVGLGELVKLTGHLNDLTDYDNLDTLSKRYGRRTLAIVEVTGATDLKSFKVRFTFLEFMIAHATSFFSWLGSLFSLGFMKPRRSRD